MKRNVIAILLSISMITGSFGATPLYAAEVSLQEAITENEQDAEGMTSVEETTVSEDKETEETNSGSSEEQDENEIAEEEVLSGEEAVVEEAGNAATVVDTEIAAVVEPTVESTEGKEAALAGETGDVVASGTCGENATWTLTGTENDLTLTISGSGDMVGYSSYTDDTPWANYKTSISTIEIQDGICSIGDYAFSGCSNLHSVTFSNSVDEIGSYGFANCSTVSSIELPDSLNTIRDHAFYSCSSLSSISLPDTLQFLGGSAFQECNSLNSISIPDSVTVCGDYVFDGCSLNELRIPVSIVSSGRNTSLLQGVNTVKLIIYGEGDIPNTVYGCMGSSSLRESLVDLVLEGNITFIGSSVFLQNDSSCPQFTSLQTITLPATVTGFYGSERNKITNENITVIGYGNTYSEIWALTNKYTFEAIDVIELSGTLNNGISWVLSSDRTLTISGNGAVSQNPCPWQQYVRVIKKVVIEEGITEIGDCSFCNGGRLIEEVTLPESLTKIGSYAFAYCAIESITIPSGVTEIKNNAFYNSHLTSIDIPENVTTLGNNAFGFCESLEELRIPNHALCDRTLNCQNLKTIYIYGEGVLPTSCNMFRYNNNAIENIIIEEGITSVNTNMFGMCDNASYVRLPSTIGDRDVSGYAPFSQCSNLKTAGPLGSGCNIEFGWTERIPSYAFASIKSLESIVFPENLKEIGESAFWFCENLQEIVFPDTVESIEQAAFRGCGLMHVYVPSSVETMGTYVFCDCPNLKSAGPADSGCDIEYGWTVKIPDNAFTDCSFDTVRLADTIKIIGAYAFQRTIIDSFILPENLNTINEYAFFGSNINKLVFKGNIPSINTKGFYAATCTAYYPYGNETYTSNTMVGYGGSITWKADPETTGTLTELELIQEPVKKLYTVDEELSLEGLQIKSYYDSGYTDIIDNSEITVGDYDLSTTGKKQIEIGYKDKIVSFEVNVCDLNEENVDPSLYPESTHDYDNNLNIEYSFTYTDAQSLSFTFSEETAVEDDIDFLYVYDANGNLLKTYTGTSAAGQTVNIDGKSFVIKLVSDESGTAYGFSIDSITAHAYGHEWQETVFKEPTCTEEGSKGLECQVCGYQRSEVIPALGHAYEDTVVEPTCTAGGYTLHLCTQCGDSYINNETDALGHAFGEWITDQDSTCTEEGARHRLCALCGLYETNIIDKKEHAFSGDYTVDAEPTCTEAGEKSIYCNVCGEKKEGSTVEIPALGHLYGEVVIEPTCITGGYTIHVCGRCSDNYKDDETLPTGHSFGDWIIDNDSTCTEEGIQHRECEDCGYIETKGINKKEHSFDTEYTVDKEPTCTTDGSKSFHCTSEGCTATTGSEVIPATGHDYGDWTVTREATCTESGEMQRTCAVCDETEVVEFGARGHVWLKDYTVDQAPTCTEAGSKSIRCAVCDEVKEGSEHVIPATGHALTRVEAVPATYESEGNIEYYRCETCGKIYSDESCGQELSEEETVIPKKERIPVTIVTHPADVEAAADEQAVFSVEAEGSDLSYQWQYSINGTSWSNCKGTGYDTDTFSFVMNKKFAGRWYRCIVSSGEETVTSDAAVLSLKENNTITMQPEDVNASIGETVAFHVEATGENLSYQWQYSTNGTYWRNCTGSSYDSDTFSFEMQERLDGRMYCCVITADGSILISDAAAVRLKQTGEIVEQPQDQTACVGEDVSIHVGFSGDNPEYQWQYSLNGSSWSNCRGSGYNSDTFGFVMQEKFAGRQYRCVIKAGGMTYTSDSATVRIDESEMITSQPEDVTLAAGEIASFHVGTSGSGLTYQWQWSADGNKWKNCTGAGYSTDTFSFVAQTRFTGRRYRCVVTYGTKVEYSESGLLTVME